MYQYWIICTSCTTQVVNWLQTDKLKVMKCLVVMEFFQMLFLCDAMSDVSVVGLVLEFPQFFPVLCWKVDLRIITSVSCQFASVTGVHTGESWRGAWGGGGEESIFPVCLRFYERLPHRVSSVAWVVAICNDYCDRFVYPYKTALQHESKDCHKKTLPAKKGLAVKT